MFSFLYFSLFSLWVDNYDLKIILPILEIKK